jgi:hypothetical protein
MSKKYHGRRKSFMIEFRTLFFNAIAQNIALLIDTLKGFIGPASGCVLVFYESLQMLMSVRDE